MIKKKNLWFLTLFSLILVLSIYYITMPNELLLTNNSKTNKDKTQATVEVNESEVISALKVEEDTEREKKIKELNTTLTNEKASSDEKNNAYNKIKELNNTKGEQEKLEKKIKDELSLDSFVKIDSNKISVTIESKKHDSSLANKIMRCIQEEYEDNKYITVTFRK